MREYVPPHITRRRMYILKYKIRLWPELGTWYGNYISRVSRLSHSNLRKLDYDRPQIRATGSTLCKTLLTKDCILYKSEWKAHCEEHLKDFSIRRGVLTFRNKLILLDDMTVLSRPMINFQQTKNGNPGFKKSVLLTHIEEEHLENFGSKDLIN